MAAASANAVTATNDCASSLDRSSAVVYGFKNEKTLTVMVTIPDTDAAKVNRSLKGTIQGRRSKYTQHYRNDYSAVVRIPKPLKRSSRVGWDLTLENTRAPMKCTFTFRGSARVQVITAPTFVGVTVPPESAKN